jgi:hypothetical protein
MKSAYFLAFLGTPFWFTPISIDDSDTGKFVGHSFGWPRKDANFLSRVTPESGVRFPRTATAMAGKKNDKKGGDGKKGKREEGEKKETKVGLLCPSVASPP